MKSIEKLSRQSESPFLAQKACLRTAGSDMPGYYSKELNMWVVDSSEGPTPIISEGALAQLVTKTNVQVEQDDDSPYTLQLMTKTEQQLEGDDESHFITSRVLQLLTKTDTTHEVDDNFNCNQFSDLMGQSPLNQDGDDDL